MGSQWGEKKKKKNAESCIYTLVARTPRRTLSTKIDHMCRHETQKGHDRWQVQVQLYRAAAKQGETKGWRGSS